MLPRSHIELPAMPRTGDDVPRKRPFSQRPSRMGANTVQRMKFTVDMKERNQFPLDAVIDPVGFLSMKRFLKVIVLLFLYRCRVFSLALPILFLSPCLRQTLQRKKTS